MKMIAVPSSVRISFFLGCLFLVLSTNSFSQTTARIALASTSLREPELLANEPGSSSEKVAKGKETVNTSVKEFKGQKNKEGVQLSWQMANANADGFFEIQRSLSGGSYIKIGALLSSQSNTYQFIDKSVVQPAYYYRVKIINTEGLISYSNPILVEIKKTSKAVIKKTAAVITKKESVSTPKTDTKTIPAKKIISLKTTKQFSSSVLHFSDRLIFNLALNKKGTIQVNLSTMSGRISLQREYAGQTGNNEVVVDHLGLLPEGSYTLVVKSNGQKFNLLAKK